MFKRVTFGVVASFCALVSAFGSQVEHAQAQSSVNVTGCGKLTQSATPPKVELGGFLAQRKTINRAILPVTSDQAAQAFITVTHGGKRIDRSEETYGCAKSGTGRLFALLEPATHRAIIRRKHTWHVQVTVRFVNGLSKETEVTETVPLRAQR